MDCGKRQLFWGFSMSFQGKWRKLSTACRRQNVCHEFVCDPHICRLPSAEKLLPSVHNLGICRGGKLLLAVPPKMRSIPSICLPKQLANIYSLIVSAIESVQTHSHLKKPAHTFVQHPGNTLCGTAQRVLKGCAGGGSGRRKGQVGVAFAISDTIWGRMPIHMSSDIHTSIEGAPFVLLTLVKAIGISK